MNLHRLSWDYRTPHFSSPASTTTSPVASSADSKIPKLHETIFLPLNWIQALVLALVMTSVRSSLYSSDNNNNGVTFYGCPPSSQRFRSYRIVKELVVSSACWPVAAQGSGNSLIKSTCLLYYHFFTKLRFVPNRRQIFFGRKVVGTAWRLFDAPQQIDKQHKLQKNAGFTKVTNQFQSKLLKP